MEAFKDAIMERCTEHLGVHPFNALVFPILGDSLQSVCIFLHLTIMAYFYIFNKLIMCLKVKVGNDQEKAQSERDFHSKNRWKKITIRYVYYENIS